MSREINFTADCETQLTICDRCSFIDLSPLAVLHLNYKRVAVTTSPKIIYLLAIALMTQSPITVTYSLEEVLTRLEQNINARFTSIEAKIDNAQKDLADLKVGQARLEERFNSLETRFDSMDKRIEKIENTQKNQVWTMITLLGGSLITVALRFFLFGNNP